MRLDAHHHLWRLGRCRYDWLADAPQVLRRDFEASELAPLLAARGVEGTVLVQASDTVEETRFLLREARACGFVVGVVGWAPLDAEDGAEVVRDLARDPLLVGLRPMLQDLADDEFVLRAELGPALDALEASNLVLDALVRPRQLDAVVALAERRPELALVLDHAGKPEVARGRSWSGFGRWRDALRRLARVPSTRCKLSGLVTEAGADRGAAALAPFVDVVLEAFGPRRTLWGSDWPVLNAAASYGEWWDTTGALLAGLDESDRDWVMGRSAATTYGLAARREVSG